MLEFVKITNTLLEVKWREETIGDLWYDSVSVDWTYEGLPGYSLGSADLRRIADMLDKLGYGPLEDKT